MKFLDSEKNPALINVFWIVLDSDGSDYLGESSRTVYIHLVMRAIPCEHSSLRGLECQVLEENLYKVAQASVLLWDIRKHPAFNLEPES